MTSKTEAYNYYAYDYNHVDGLENITYTPRNPSTSSVANVKAKRYAFTKKEAKAGVAFVENSDLTMMLWDVSLGGKEPAAGDLITDAAGIDFVVLAAQREHWDTQWRCFLRREV